MVIDIIIIAILIFLLIVGYIKGFMIGLINLVFWIGYFMVADQIFNFSLNLLSDNIINTVDFNNEIIKYLIILVVGLFLMLFINIIARKIIRKSFLSFFDRVGGMLLSLALGYLVICLASIIIINLGMFIDFSQEITDSYFLSSDFNEYNIIYRWWLNA
ncbi:CvpA family protein [Erysipelotrichaceae bacterium OttesenSCG-928-M19]|nr:CvpA family protein [Erysipelotrichaceae bacterium OttesenSCG-928-M19]